MTDETIAVLKVKELRQIVREEFQALTRKEPEPELSERMTRRQAANFLQVSYQSMYNYTKAGLLRDYGIKGKKFFLKKELIDFITNKKV
jgi:hypothetical protein